MMNPWVMAVLAVTACSGTPNATTPSGGPRGLRASDHLEAARQHDEVARSDGRLPDRVPIGPGQIDQPVRTTWARSWRAEADNTRLAAEHRSKAAGIEAEYEAACEGRASDAIAISPLVRYGIGGTPTAHGALVYLDSAAGTPDALMAALRCHRAYMMLAPSGMDACPLDLPGLSIDAHGDTDGITVELAVDEPKLVPELQRRAAHDLEASGHARPELSVRKGKP